MLKIVTYAARPRGTRLLVTGAIHGNEKCGTVAIERVMQELNAGKLRIARGAVTFVPICNPRAYEADTRFLERNLNRYLVPMEKPDTYEAELGNLLCPLFENCDALLDIHSYTIGGDPFISYDGLTQEECAFAASLGVHTLLTGWGEIYLKMGRGRAISAEEATGGPQYARRFGASAVTIECGQHMDPYAPEVAHSAILRALRHFGMIEGDEPPPLPTRHIHMTHVFYRDSGGEFPGNWRNLEPVKKGAVMALYPDEKSIPAPEDGFIIMPRPNCPVGEEWFYFGVEKPAG